MSFWPKASLSIPFAARIIFTFINVCAWMYLKRRFDFRPYTPAASCNTVAADVLWQLQLIPWCIVYCRVKSRRGCFRSARRRRWRVLERPASTVINYITAGRSPTHSTPVYYDIHVCATNVWCIIAVVYLLGIYARSSDNRRYLTLYEFDIYFSPTI